MANMFRYATSFNQDLGGWDVTNVGAMGDILTGVTLSTANYDALLIGWEAQAVQSDVSFSAGNSVYSTLEAWTARQSLVAYHSWTITDGGRAVVPTTDTAGAAEGAHAVAAELSPLDSVTFQSDADIGAVLSALEDAVAVTDVLTSVGADLSGLSEHLGSELAAAGLEAVLSAVLDAASADDDVSIAAALALAGATGSLVDSREPITVAASILDQATLIEAAEPSCFRWPAPRFPKRGDFRA